MFERTLEAQALDATSAKVSPFSIALAVHVAAFAVILGVSLMIVPNVTGPKEPPPIIAILPEPLEYRPEQPAAPAPPPPKRGVEDPGPATVPPPEVILHPENPPEVTPSDLPPPIDDYGDDGVGKGERGDADGDSDGVLDGTGTSRSGPGNGDGTGTGVPQELTGDMVAPVLVHKVSPDYPNTARIARLEGKVVVEAVIGLDGSVESAVILGSSNALFDGAALSAVKQWKYRPATMDGRPVRVYFKVQVGFVLR